MNTVIFGLSFTIIVKFSGGFGSVFLKNLRQLDYLCQKRDSISELPLILGRDFAGVITAKGSSVLDFDVGDEVYGVVKPQDPGCHAEYAVTTNTLVSIFIIAGFCIIISMLKSYI